MKNIVKEKTIHYIYASMIRENENKVLLKLFKNKIPVYEVNYTKDKCFFKLKEEDYKKAKKLLKTVPIEYTRQSGIFLLFEKIKRYRIFLLAFFFGCILFFVLNHLILDVKVIHQNREIREIVSLSLEELGLKRFSFKKNYQELEEIKEKILEEYPDRIEWLEIENVGMNYIVKVEERIITKPEEEKTQCHLISTKNAVITKFVYEKGEALIREGVYVNKGDILISGQLKANEEIKENVCASGKVYGEVWYEANVVVPKTEEIKKKTGKVRWNFLYEDLRGLHNILKPRVESYENNLKKIGSILGINFYFTKQEEVQNEVKTLNSEEALEKGIALAREKTEMRLAEDEKILSLKVLKKTENDSTMELKIFLSVEQRIEEEQEYDLESEQSEVT